MLAHQATPPHESSTTPSPYGKATARPVQVAATAAATATVDITDLRKRRRKATIARILDRVMWLPAPDRLLVEAIYRDNQTAADLARLLRLDPRTVRRRVRRIVARVLSPKFMYVASRLMLPAQAPTRTPTAAIPGDDPPTPRPWNRVRRQIAEECVLNGRSIREAAEALNLSFHLVRRHCEAVHAVFDSDHIRSRP